MLRAVTHRSVHRWGCWVLVLLLAGLPLRGWAQLSMHPPTAAASVQASSMPCHEGHGADGARADMSNSIAHADPSAGTDGHHGPEVCASCDVCHGGALPAAEWQPPARHETIPAPPHASLAPRDLAPRRLERPPRT